MTPVILNTARLTLRSPLETDLERITALAGNFNVARMTARIPHPYRTEHAREFLESVRAAARTGDALQLAIALDGDFIGGVGIGRPEGKPFLGYWIGEPYWGKGYAREAAKAVVRRFFETHPDDIIASAYAVENVASARIQERLGFEVVREGAHYSLARDADVSSAFTELSRTRFYELNP